MTVATARREKRESFLQWNMNKMRHLPSRTFLAVLGLCFATLTVGALHDHNERKPYIVYMGEAPEHEIMAMEQHHNLLSTAIGDETIAREARIYSYWKSFNGFAARLLPHEARRLAREESVVSVFENTVRKLHTTRSWDFLGLHRHSRRRAKLERDIIVGVLDTGIYIDSPSFDDKGYGPAPTRWRGKCVTGPNFTHCNNKVIGAKYFNLGGYDVMAEGGPTEEGMSPADTDGHGTHTASTVAGVHVPGASLYGIARGTARGGVPAARIAVYKVCWGIGCTDMNLLAGFDEAIADGVDLISISIGGPSQQFFQDPIAIGSFHAVKKGILTTSSAGNEGPGLLTVGNVAPWLLTVAANSIDRLFKTAIILGNRRATLGDSINTFTPKKKMYPLTSGARASNISDNSYGNPSTCDYGTLAADKVKGKIVYCLGSDNGQDSTVKDLVGAGVVMRAERSSDILSPYILPASVVLRGDGNRIERYINSTRNPLAVVLKTRTVLTPMIAPSVASFSSRGPQQISLNILKPDLSAPGLNILAAYTMLTTMTGYPDDNRYSLFNILSGTSMSCPHGAAAAAYVKSFHPDWSPAAIKSALMTTATPMKSKGEDAELGYGSGQINPTKAVNPGLVYDIDMSSYIRFLCKEGYNGTTIGLLLGGKKKYNCKDFKPALGTDGLNYPSMHTQLKPTESKVSAVFYRTVTNVGNGSAVYKATVKSPKGLSIEVVPNKLNFTRSHEKKSFKVFVKGGLTKSGTQLLSGSLEWNDSKHGVKSPIVIFKSE